MLPLNASVQYGYDIPKYRVTINDACIKCGLCIDACPADVFEYPHGLNRLPQPNSYKCIYPDCNGGGETPCEKVCPVDAIEITRNPSYAVLGDKRWTGDLLNATWHEAKYARVPDPRIFEYRVGASGGGFDAMKFKFEIRNSKFDNSNSEFRIPDSELSQIDLALPLNHRGIGEQIILPLPWYGGGMSFGSVGLMTMLARAMAAKELGTFSSTGEGGFPRELEPYHDHMITQIATGLFGVREETLQ